MATKYDHLYNRDEIKRSIIDYCTVIRKIPRYLANEIKEIPEDPSQVIEVLADKFIENYHNDNAHKVTRKQFIKSLTAYRQMAIDFGDEEMLTITNKLIGDRKLFNKVLMIVDGSYVRSRIWASLGLECFNMKLDDGSHEERTSRQIKKTIDKIYRDNDYIFCQFYIDWTYEELMEEWSWRDIMEKNESEWF